MVDVPDIYIMEPPKRLKTTFADALLQSLQDASGGAFAATAAAPAVISASSVVIDLAHLERLLMARGISLLAPAKPLPLEL